MLSSGPNFIKNSSLYIFFIFGKCVYQKNLATDKQLFCKKFTLPSKFR